MPNAPSTAHFTAQQDASLLSAVRQFEKKWIVVQNRVPGKTAKECEARFRELEATGVVKSYNRKPESLPITRSATCTNPKNSGNDHIQNSVSRKPINKSPSKMKWTASPNLNANGRGLILPKQPIARQSQLGLLPLLPKPSVGNNSPMIMNTKSTKKRVIKKKASTSPVKPSTNGHYGMSSPFKPWPELQSNFSNSKLDQSNIFDVDTVMSKVSKQSNTANTVINLESLYDEIDSAAANTKGSKEKPKTKNYTTPIKVPAQTQDLNELFSLDPWADQNENTGNLFDAFNDSIEIKQKEGLERNEQGVCNVKIGANLDEFVLAPTNKKPFLELTSDNFFDDIVCQDDFFDEFLDTAEGKEKDEESDAEIDITSK